MLLVNTVLDFDSRNRIVNLAAAVAAGQPVTYEQFNAALSGLAWKDNARVAAQSNVNVSAPGTHIDAIALAINDRVLLPVQTDPTESGLYIWNGASTPMTRAQDASTYAMLESAVVTVDEGSNSGATYRQTQINGVLGTDPLIWTDFGAAAPSASETTSGVVELATQAETDAGVSDNAVITPFKLANFSGRAKRGSVTIGDGSATSIIVTHNLGTEDVQVYVREVGGLKREVWVEKQHTNTNSITLVFDQAPAINSYRVTVQG